ncbi:MAG TPA: ABC transporter substrate-binding protein [Solirubrobacteraceae bacterium]|nr:ABC transporter substrate-binding protein [Solirubrobacteraceae bacterium]
MFKAPVVRRQPVEALPSSRCARGRRLAAVLAAAAACLGVAACGSSSNSKSSSSSPASASASSSATSSAPAGTPHAGGSLTALESAGYSGDWPAGLDPATNVNDAANQDQMSAIFGVLWELNTKGALTPDLATGYKFSAGGKNVTITLRPGVKFSDGTPFNAQAVVFNWKRDLASPCTCKPTNFTVKSITAPSPTTVVVNLATPDGAFINQLQDANFSWIASPTAIKKMGEQAFKLKPVGAGPFTVVSDTLNNSLVLKKNPAYWESGHPYLDQLTFKTTASDESALEAMQAGQGQAYMGMSSPQLLNSYKSKFTVATVPSTSPYDIQLNTSIPPFNNLKAREAIYYATDASLIDQKLFGNVNPVGQSFTAPAGLFYEQNVPGYPTYDLAKAKSIVKSLGGLTINFFTIQQPATTNFMEALQSMWKQAGINASIHFYPLAGLIQQFDTKKWQIALQTAGAWDPAGGVGLAFRFLSASPFSGVHDPHLDSLILGGQGAISPTTRKSMYDQAAAYIAKNAYGPFLFPLANWNIAGHGVQGAGLTTPIPPVAVNGPVLWEDVSTSSS